MEAPEIGIERWGKDHWSTFAYIETCAVEGLAVDADRMRTHPRLHLSCFQAKRHGGEFADGSNYPTRLKGGEEVAPHDDWSCVEDMIAEGLLETAPHRSDGSGRKPKPHSRIAYGQKCALCDPLTGLCDATYKLTPKGFAVAHQLREHKAGGGNFADFTSALDVAAATVGA
jgi:hypothetical protein